MKFPHIFKPSTPTGFLSYPGIFVTGLLLVLLSFGSSAGQKEPSQVTGPPRSSEQDTKVAERVAVKPVASDRAIEKRLTGILKETGWFSDISVRVGEGVVFLDGETGSADYRSWAGELAGKTGDVVAVVNRIRVAEGSPWNFSPAVSELQVLWKQALQKLPRLVFGLLVLVLATMAAWVVAAGARKLLEGRLKPLLRDVTARVLSIFIFLIGLYLVLQVAGLSRLAATVLGGTGLAGLVAGIAFRDILENYLASILISIRNPFRLGDLVEIAGHTGVVQKVTTRGTVLMNLDGNHVQIPNATVYKSIIRNYSANPNRRENFEVGIGYDSEISHAQEVAREVLNEHPAVLRDPEALILVDRLGSATVNLRAYFWYDGSVYNGPKIKSSLIRLVKRAFEDAGISMPDEAREILFPEGVPVRMLEAGVPEGAGKKAHEAGGPEAVTTEAEGDLASEDEQLRDQARKSRVPEEGESLLEERDRA